MINPYVKVVESHQLKNVYSVVCTLYILLFQRLSVGILLIVFINLVEQLIVVVSSAMAGIRESRLRPIRIKVSAQGSNYVAPV